jgi:hypothetical protein
VRAVAARRAASYHGTISASSMPVHLGRKELAMDFYGFSHARTQKPDKTRIFKIR